MKRLRCGKSNSSTSGPQAEEDNLLKCPMCGAAPRNPDGRVGQVITCRGCGGYFRIGGNGEKAGGQLVLSERAWSQLEQSLKLSPREVQVVRRILDDQKELAIAADLGISPHTVHAYLERLYRKLHVTSRVQLVVRVFSEYLAPRGNGK